MRVVRDGVVDAHPELVGRHVMVAGRVEVGVEDRR